MINGMIITLCAVGILHWFVEYFTADTEEEYLTWEELIEQIKKERKEEDDED